MDPSLLVGILTHDTLEAIISGKTSFERKIDFEEGLELLGNVYGEATQSSRDEVQKFKKSLEVLTILPGEPYLNYLLRMHNLPVEWFIENAIAKSKDRARNTYERWNGNPPLNGRKI